MNKLIKEYLDKKIEKCHDSILINNTKLKINGDDREWTIKKIKETMEEKQILEEIKRELRLQ